MHSAFHFGFRPFTLCNFTFSPTPFIMSFQGGSESGILFLFQSVIHIKKPIPATVSMGVYITIAAASMKPWWTNIIFLH